MSRLFGRPALAFVAGALIVAAVVGGRAAYAALGDDVITACFKPSNGTLYLVGDGSRRADCQPGDRPISWNAQGPPGVGVTSVALAPGADPNCPLGGSKFTSASGATYACNGGFSAESRSPNGAFRIRLNDTGIALEGPAGRINVTTSGITVDAATTLALRGAFVDFDALATLDVDANGLATINSPQLQLNGAGCGFLRPTDVNPVIGPNGGVVLLNFLGTPTVRTGC